ncbi:acetyl-CoA carboxylase biotin carboxyl carrier protein [Fulvivirgaceae bacterium BMA12]|uniref:Biotin carboxyl carrier protein of acetyl-CoA carboxylase n=1 Tax=Agaribacillus aureus TaxID=3051825 RepID=A0ABT8LCD8_9BACT|nr:acetyl-CoA carboxylase biotin carboxyl carrier protein [Fulvivirgaceae bacterium BMA12]
MKAKELQDLLDFIAKSGLDEVNIETEEYKIKVKKSTEPKTRIVEAAPVATPPPVAPVQNNVQAAPVATDNAASSPAPVEDPESKYISIKSPMIGTFYRSATPDSEPFLNIGDKVTSGATVCIVEAMKLFNEIESEVSGTVVKILVENASPVEYDQPLFLVDPS